MGLLSPTPRTLSLPPSPAVVADIADLIERGDLAAVDPTPLYRSPASRVLAARYLSAPVVLKEVFVASSGHATPAQADAALAQLSAAMTVAAKLPSERVPQLLAVATEHHAAHPQYVLPRYFVFAAEAEPLSSWMGRHSVPAAPPGVDGVALRIVADAAEALAALHAAGFGHGGLRASCVLVSARHGFRGKLGGITGVLPLAGDRLPAPHRCLAPELMGPGASAAAVAAADVWALGLILLEHAARRGGGRPMADVAAEHRGTQFQQWALTEARSIPGPVAALAAECLEWDPAARPSSAAVAARFAAASEDSSRASRSPSSAAAVTGRGIAGWWGRGLRVHLPGAAPWVQRALAADDHTVVAACTHALRTDPRDPCAWALLAIAMPLDGTADVAGRTGLRRLHCAAEAALCGPDVAVAWEALCWAMPGDRRVSVGDESLSRADVCRHCLALDPESGWAWRWLAAEEDPTALGSQHSPRSCLTRAVECYPAVGDLWVALAGAVSPTEAVAVGGRTVAGLDCYIAALEAGSDSPAAWAAVADSLGPDGRCVRLRGQWLSARECRDRASGAQAAPVPAVERGDVSAAAGAVLSSAVAAVVLSPSDATAWAQLGGALPTGAEATVAGIGAVTAEDCYRRAVTCDAASTVGWLGLGDALGAERTATVGDEALGQPQCYARGAAADPSSGAAWARLGAALSSRDGPVAGVPHDAAACFARAAELDPTDAPAWSNLGRCAGAGTAVVGGTAVTGVECFERALRLDPALAAAWTSAALLAHTTGTTVDAGGPRTAVECAVAAVELDPSPHAWNVLGVTLGTETCTVGGAPIAARDCYARAAALPDAPGQTWANLARELSEPGATATVGPRTMTRCQCYVVAVERDPALAGAWASLGLLAAKEPVSVSGAACTVTECYQRSLGLRPDAAVWTNLGTALGPGATVVVGGSTVDEQACYLAALALDARSALAWTYLGATVVGPDTVDVGGAPRTAIECFTEALSIDPDSATAWAYLGARLPRNGDCEVGGERRTKADCCAAAIARDPTLAGPWAGLGTSLAAAKGTYNLPGRGEITAAGALAEALGLDPLDGAVWFNLGIALRPPATASFGGGPVARLDCLARAAELLPRCAPVWKALATELRGGGVVTVRGVDMDAERCSAAADAA